MTINSAKVNFSQTHNIRNLERAHADGMQSFLMLSATPVLFLRWHANIQYLLWKERSVAIFIRVWMLVTSHDSQHISNQLQAKQMPENVKQLYRCAGNLNKLHNTTNTKNTSRAQVKMYWILLKKYLQSPTVLSIYVHVMYLLMTTIKNTLKQSSLVRSTTLKLLYVFCIFHP